ncbi:MAG: DUF4870 domain-containing protein [Acidimicrobiia bacterium]
MPDPTDPADDRPDPADELPPEPDWGGVGESIEPEEPSPAPPAATETTLGVSQNIGALLAYVLGWVSGLVVWLLEQDNREVRFHAAQSVLVFGGLTIISTVFGLIPIIGIIVAPIVGLVGFVLWIYLMVQGYSGNHVALPVIGDLAEEWADRRL